MKVFLGGTCNNSTWREDLIPLLEKCNIEYYNPVVDDWTEECIQEEIKQRKECDICLYCITKEMIGVYSIAEVVDDSNKRPDKTAMILLEKGFNKDQLKSLKQVMRMVENNGSFVANSLEKFVGWLIVDYLI